MVGRNLQDRGEGGSREERGEVERRGGKQRVKMIPKITGK